MLVKGIFILSFLFAFICEPVLAQNDQAKPDSSKMYRDIETFSHKRKGTNFIYQLFFKPVDLVHAQKSKGIQKSKPRRQYSKFEGKVIREIHIETLDPFGYSVADTEFVVQNGFYRTGNRLHIKTQRITVRNLLLFHKYDIFDSLLVKESERLVRTQKYVHDVFFYAQAAGSDSVDIYIREWDNWSIIPSGSISPSSITIDLKERNFLGFGHEFENKYTRNYIRGRTAYLTNYFIPNIMNTYVNTNLHYGVDEYQNFNRSVSVDRPFFSSFAKWAAGVALAYQYKKDSLLNSDQTYLPYTLKFRAEDYWAGKSEKIFKGNTEDARATSLIIAARYLHTHYIEKPEAQYDPDKIYSDENFYLAGIGIVTRKYIQDKYIFNYGVTEDVPVGQVYALTAGYQVRNNAERLYLGLRYSIGNYYRWGYLSTDLEYGSFFRSSHAEQSVLSLGLNYFTDLVSIGRWQFRQFVKPQIILGINRLVGEKISLNNETGIRGFNSISTQGTKKILLTIQTQFYAPWNVLGFHFGPYLICSVGMLGDDHIGFKRSRLYTQFGPGVLIRNEFLVFNNFQISFSYYPIIPDDGHNIFKINSNSTTDFGFRDFVIGKPSTVVYQ